VVLHSACKARSFIVGIPNGRFSSVPGFGIITLRVGCDFSVSFKLLTRLIRCFGVSDLTPSTPPVFLPWLSCVTLGGVFLNAVDEGGGHKPRVSSVTQTAFK